MHHILNVYLILNILIETLMSSSCTILIYYSVVELVALVIPKYIWIFGLTWWFMGLTSGLKWRSHWWFREKIALRVRWRCGFSLAVPSLFVWIWRRPTMDTTVELPFFRHDYTLLCRISLFLHCIFFIFRCGISLLHNRDHLFLHWWWSLLLIADASLCLFFQWLVFFGTMVEYFFVSTSTFWEQKDDDVFFENSTISVTCTTCK